MFLIVSVRVLFMFSMHFRVFRSCSAFFVCVPCGSLFLSSDLWRTPKHEMVIVFAEVDGHWDKRRQLHSAFIQLQVGRTHLRTLKKLSTIVSELALTSPPLDNVGSQPRCVVRHADIVSQINGTLETTLPSSRTSFGNGSDRARCFMVVQNPHKMKLAPNTCSFPQCRELETISPLFFGCLSFRSHDDSGSVTRRRISYFMLSVCLFKRRYVSPLSHAKEWQHGPKTHCCQHLNNDTHPLKMYALTKHERHHRTTEPMVRATTSPETRSFSANLDGTMVALMSTFLVQKC